MAINLVASPKWEEYQAFSKYTKTQFQKISRLYALLHDIGHLPLSHLFETALVAHYNLPKSEKFKICEDLFAETDFEKPHEAFGSILGPQILSDALTKAKEDPVVIAGVITLLTNKELVDENPLVPIKSLIDSEIDADRIDSVARDGMLAGGEYGSYDIRRLCDAVFLFCEEGNHWNLTFSHKALSSIEGLLLDRLRVHNWVHFHHRVIALKVAMIEVIKGLLENGLLKEIKTGLEDGSLLRKVFDDIWLFSKIRDWEPTEKITKLARNAVLNRDTSKFKTLWKSRIACRNALTELKNKIVESAKKQKIRLEKDFEEKFPTILKKDFGGVDNILTEAFGTPVRHGEIPFKPLTNRRLYITTNNGVTVDTQHELLATSKLIELLNEIWENEIQIYPVIFGDDVTKRNNSSDKEVWVSIVANGRASK
jgi:HD superfamily phosphohydrolase